MHIHQSDMPEVCLADERYKAPAQSKLFFFFYEMRFKMMETHLLLLLPKSGVR